MQNNKTDFGRLTSIMEKVTEAGGILLVHSEDDDMVHYNYDNAQDDGLMGLVEHASHPLEPV